MSKFITFRPEWEYDNRGCRNICISPATQINTWLEANPNVEVISWQATPVGDHNELYLTIQYRDYSA